jgi:hypothetical protein
MQALSQDLLFIGDQDPIADGHNGCYPARVAEDLAGEFSNPGSVWGLIGWVENPPMPEQVIGDQNTSRAQFFTNQGERLLVKEYIVGTKAGLWQKPARVVVPEKRGL